MVIDNQRVVSFDYTLKDTDGNVIDSSDGNEPLSYLHGAGNILPALEAEMQGKTEGDEFSAVIPPEEGYGVRDDSLVGDVPLTDLEGIPNLKVGQQLEAQTPTGPRVVRITAVNDSAVTIDANHPLAGVTLHFDVKVADIREATADELEHGHAHGAGGHHH
jgi:FKBP-type peptidyl-prolyl cis-trans isomerase SlyD